MSQGTPSLYKYKIYAEKIYAPSETATKNPAVMTKGPFNYDEAIDMYRRGLAELQSEDGKSFLIVLYRDLNPIEVVAADGISSGLTPPDIVSKLKLNTPKIPPTNEPVGSSQPWYNRWQTWAVVGSVGVLGLVIGRMTKKCSASLSGDCHDLYQY